MSRQEYPIIVGGCHRSGTTLVRRILNAHSGIYCGAEIKFFRDFYGDYFDDPLRRLRFIESARHALPDDELFTLLGSAFVALHERAAVIAGKRRWADKNPENVLYLGQWNRLLGERWLFVHVVRNPLDTLASIREREFPLSVPTDLEGAVEHYKRYTQAGVAYSKRKQPHCFRVQYEMLIHHPKETARHLMEWLGEELEPSQLNLPPRGDHRPAEESATATRDEVSVDRIQRWQKILSPDEVKYIWEETGDIWKEIDPDNTCGLSLP